MAETKMVIVPFEVWQKIGKWRIDLNDESMGDVIEKMAKLVTLEKLRELKEKQK